MIDPRDMDIVPAFVQHLAAIFRIAGRTEPVYERVDSHTATMTVNHTSSDGDVYKFTLTFEFFSSRWRLSDIDATKNGEEMDLDEGIQEILELLNAHDDGPAKASKITHTSGTARNRGVEVRKTTVIRT